jgi:hypothetical protein
VSDAAGKVVATMTARFALILAPAPAPPVA